MTDKQRQTSSQSITKMIEQLLERGETALLVTRIGGPEHVGLGTDLDGGYGTEQSPHDLDTIADLRKLDPLLKARGYTEEDLTKIMHGNWLRLFKRAWNRN